MSLVSEALRKARQEAARRDAAERGGAFPAPRVVTPGRRSTKSLTVLAVAVAAIGGAAAAWWAVGRAPAPAAAVATTPAPPAAQAAVQPSGGLSAGPAGSGGVAAPQAPALAAPGSSQGAEPLLDGGGVRQEAPPSATQPPEPPRQAAAPPPVEHTAEARSATRSPAEGQPRPGQPRTFVAHADLGYATLELGYIAYLPSAPFAQINGADVHVGAVVDGFVVKKITANAVTLEDDHGEVVLKVR